MTTPSTLPSKQVKTVPAVVFEVLQGVGLAQLNGPHLLALSFNKGTPGVPDFTTVEIGQHWLCTVAQPFNRVVHAQLVSPASL